MNVLVSMIGEINGCMGYRIKNPYKAIEDKDLDIIFLKGSHTGEDILNLVSGANVIILRPGQEKLFKMIKDKHISEAKIIVDFDDDIYNMSPYTDNYRISGLKEVEHEGQMLWKDGKNGFNIADNKKRVEETLYMIRNADLITVTTEYLANELKKMGAKKVEVLDNAIDFKHWKNWELKKNKKIRIGWTGGSTHYIDWYSIKDPLKRVFEKYDNLELVLQGCKWDGTLKGIPYEFHDWISFDGHPYKTASLNLDIAIIPLVDNKFNRSKSCIKWYEFSSLGIPSVVSDILPYAEVIDEFNSMPYKTPEEFESQLCKLIESKELRNTIGKEAYKYVKKNKDLKDISKEYINIIKKLWKTKI